MKHFLFESRIGDLLLTVFERLTGRAVIETLDGRLTIQSLTEVH